MGQIPKGEMPPKILRYDLFRSDQAPALAIIKIQTEEGSFSFLANKQILEALGNGCLSTATKLRQTGDLN